MNEASVITGFLDANVLYPALLRDILLRLASQNVFRARWSARVHDEWTSALIRDRPDILFARIERTRRLMDAHFQDARSSRDTNLVSNRFRCRTPTIATSWPPQFIAERT